MKQHLALSRLQAGALARLIQSQIAAYDETSAAPGGRKASHRKIKPFTGRDLDRLEPLLEILEKLSARP